MLQILCGNCFTTPTHLSLDAYLQEMEPATAQKVAVFLDKLQHLLEMEESFDMVRKTLPSFPTLYQYHLSIQMCSSLEFCYIYMHCSLTEHITINKKLICKMDRYFFDHSVTPPVNASYLMYYHVKYSVLRIDFSFSIIIFILEINIIMLNRFYLVCFLFQTLDDPSGNSFIENPYPFVNAIAMCAFTVYH